MLERVLQSLKSQPVWRILVIACGSLVVLGTLDWISPTHLQLGIFYLFPIALVTLFVGRLSGMVMAIVCAEIWFFAELRADAVYVHPIGTYATAILRLVFFILAVVLLSTWREIGQGLERIVDERTSTISSEIAERKAAEHTLHRLAMQLAEAEDAQRRQLAHDIHDALGQTLSLVKFRLESAAASAYQSEQRNTLVDCLRHVDKLIAQTRTLTFDLHPPMLDDLGLVPAVRWYAKEFKRQTGAKITVQEIGDPRMPELPVNTYLFRSIKELVNNAMKHGAATEIVASVHWVDSKVRIVIDDNGRGFDKANPTQPPGLGLAGIHERATTLGGELLIESEPGKGCRAILQLPLS